MGKLKKQSKQNPIKTLCFELVLLIIICVSSCIWFLAQY